MNPQTVEVFDADRRLLGAVKERDGWSSWWCALTGCGVGEHQPNGLPAVDQLGFLLDHLRESHQ